MEHFQSGRLRNLLVVRFPGNFCLKAAPETIVTNVGAVKALQNRGINRLREVFNYKIEGEG